MPGTDLTQGWAGAKSNLEAIKTYNDVSSSSKILKKDAGDSSSKSVSNSASQLSSISSQQKRYQREPPTSMDNLLNMFGSTSGSGSQSLKYLVKKLLEVAVLIEPEVARIMHQESLKVLGCSQEQTYTGTPSKDLEYNPLNTIPIINDTKGIYIPVSSIDFAGNLKNSPDTSIGKVYYEHLEPSVNPYYKPYGGNVPYPMNKELFNRLGVQNQSYKTQYGRFYQGKSGQDLFDFQYTKINPKGISGDYYRIVLTDRTDENGNINNNVGQLLMDYYGTINLVDSADFGAQLVNLISSAISIKSNLGYDELDKQSRFFLIIQRILGLCFDSRREIDVSGVAKVAELDGVDDSFYEMTEIDLRNIDLNISNIQDGVMEFEDCNNVKLPVNYDILVDELINYRATLSGKTTEQQVKGLENIIDTITQNPDWKLLIPSSLNTTVSINKNVLKQIPKAVAAAVLTPKVLLPIFILLSVVEKEAIGYVNKQITSANTVIQSANTTSNNAYNQVNNTINDGTEFLKKFKQFNIEVISKIGQIFLKKLFELLKKDIIHLLSAVISDISKSKALKKYSMILRLVQLALVVIQLISDYRHCKSLLDDILTLLQLINGVGGGGIPSPLLFLTSVLPGTSPERSSINTIEELQKLGIPTGVLPDGSPNLMLLYNLAAHKGSDKENAENGKIEAIGITPPIAGGIVKIFGKAF
jgi:hypothetical protein